MSLTLDTSQVEMSPVNLCVPEITSLSNTWLMSVTADTSHDPISPCTPLEQSVDNCRHSLMAVWSSALESGGHPVVSFYEDYAVGVSSLHVWLSKSHIKALVVHKCDGNQDCRCNSDKGHAG